MAPRPLVRPPKPGTGRKGVERYSSFGRYMPPGLWQGFLLVPGTLWKSFTNPCRVHESAMVWICQGLVLLPLPSLAANRPSAPTNHERWRACMTQDASATFFVPYDGLVRDLSGRDLGASRPSAGFGLEGSVLRSVFKPIIWMQTDKFGMKQTSSSTPLSTSCLASSSQHRPVSDLHPMIILRVFFIDDGQMWQ